MTPPKPLAPFDAPWHGQVFALAVALNEAGHFSWPEWTKLFGAGLKEAGYSAPLDGSHDYYTVWVATLETMLCQKGIADIGLLSAMKSNWTAAFLSTPHGQPVHPTLPKILQAEGAARADEGGRL
ncbi:MAG TPA: nitrile hydratase accessory protein [Rhodobacteraceae bacterium]|nr:nitrile hydratase accessory protein [Paracoccaceae bacterium]